MVIEAQIELIQIALRGISNNIKKHCVSPLRVAHKAYVCSGDLPNNQEHDMNDVNAHEEGGINISWLYISTLVRDAHAHQLWDILQE